MDTIYKFEASDFRKEYNLNNLDFFTRGVYSLITSEFSYGKTFSVLAIMRYSTESVFKIKASLDALVLFGFIKLA